MANDYDYCSALGGVIRFRNSRRMEVKHKDHFFFIKNHQTFYKIIFLRIKILISLKAETRTNTYIQFKTTKYYSLQIKQYEKR